MLQTIYTSVISCCCKGQEDGHDGADQPYDDDDRNRNPNHTEDARDSDDEEAGVLETTKDDSKFWASRGPVDDETRKLLQTSLHSRVEEYRQALARTEQPIRRSAPIPFT